MVTVTDLSKVISSGFTKSTLNDILRKKTGLTNVNVKEITLNTSSKKGDSYLSTITRLTIEANANNGSGGDGDFEVHVIVKSIPKSLARVKSFRSLDFFGTEINFYDKAWPILDAFQKSKQLTEFYDSIPLCLATFTDGKSDFLALEDLSYQGFKALDRSGAGLDLDMTLCILKNFANFHAISVAYREQHPKEFQTIDENLRETYFDEKFRNWYRNTMNKFCLVMKDIAEKELPSKYLKKIEEVTSEDLYGNICKLLRQRTPLSAVTHGDCWPPNFLVQDQNNTKKLALIDFQLTRVASLTTDVLFLLCTCVDPLVRNQHWDHILREYHANLVKFLNDLGSTVNITFEMFNEEIKQYGLFAFGMCNEALIMSLMEDEDVADLDTIQGDDEIPVDHIWKIEPIKDKEKRQRVADYLKHLIDYDLI